MKSVRKQVWLFGLPVSAPDLGTPPCSVDRTCQLYSEDEDRGKKKESSLFPGVGKQLIASRYFEMKLLPWECFHIAPLITMGRNREQCSSQNSRNKGRKLKLEEQVPKKGLIQSKLCILAEWGEFVGQQFSSKGQDSHMGWSCVILRWVEGGGPFWVIVYRAGNEGEKLET